MVFVSHFNLFSIPLVSSNPEREHCHSFYSVIDQMLVLLAHQHIEPIFLAARNLYVRCVLERVVLCYVIHALIPTTASPRQRILRTPQSRRLRWGSACR